MERSINETPPLTVKEGGIIKDGFNSELDELRSIRKGGKDFLSKFENEERERTGIKTLKVGYNKVFGYYIEVSKGACKDIKDEFKEDEKKLSENGCSIIYLADDEKEHLMVIGQVEDVERLLKTGVRI